ncbi:DMT family transporter [Pseudoponticoccus marisrubri]|uniref:Transporter n=1 Tax=Pseudoponticoccus marisrubri TaxID=1685382 RepID=A0A0W7WMQ8_9RHOB|nr:DMT family transporter [Pseudoponticoccus marisrubri]KUF11872.1 transporter [Pseudoponticoccus marisrubri]
MHVLRAITLMVLAMAFLAGSDASIKLATRDASVGQAMFLVSLGGTLVFYAMCRIKGVPVFHRAAWHRMVLLRNGFEVVGAIGMVFGVAYVSLSVFAAILQAAPLVVTLGAAVFLKEPVGWRRWSAIGVGIIGMLMVIRPFGAGFTGWEVFPLLGISALAARDLVTRLSPTEIPALALSTWGFAAPIPVGLALFALTPQAADWSGTTLWPIAVAILVTPAGYLCVTTAMRLAPAAIVSPFRYSRLIFTTGLGIAIFGDRPDAWTLSGAGLILAAGLYTFVRERRLARAATA